MASTSSRRAVTGVRIRPAPPASHRGTERDR
jgi:hypothetical protein